MTVGVYAYGVVPSNSVMSIEVTGIDAGLVRFETEGELATAVSDVAIDQFEGEALERNVGEPEWLEGKVRAHESVLDVLVAAGPVVPMRFGSIFSTADLLRDMMRNSATDLLAGLDRVRGHHEWGVKVYIDSTSGVVEASSTPATASGRDYLLQKRSQLHAAERALEQAGEVAERVHGSLAALAAESAVMPSRDGGRALVLNAAYLVAHEERDSFMTAATELEEQNGGAFVLEITGPWPPYNFTSVDVSGTLS